MFRSCASRVAARPAGASGARLVLDLAPAEAQLIVVTPGNPKP